MKKKIGMLLLSAFAVVTVLTAPQGKAEAWWTDHGPNHRTAPQSMELLDWWTDFGPNISQPDVEPGTEIIEEPTPVADILEPAPDNTLAWWTDHGPNH
ncbi:hypothetical protein [Tumebacillus lipolyticus]|uniref:Secreted protein n=1 Tax=Tumebacillus lipolyticus TaxID=1280370 RepID=A0ABW4ZWV5_9BACL